MTAKSTTRKRPSTRHRDASLPDPTLRHLWLAGLGGIALAQRGANARLHAVKQQVERIAGQFQANLSQVRTQGEAGVERFSSEVEQRLAPVLVKLGLVSPPAPKRRVRKPAARKVSQRARRAG